jgi:hypothetical protein
MLADVEAYGPPIPAYRENPIAETLRAVAGLKADPGFAKRYGSSCEIWCVPRSGS